MRTAALLIALLCVARVAGAEDLQAAKQHFDRGQTLYDLQRYLESAREYELAYEAKADPAFLYDIGQAYRLAGDPARALGAYRAFRRHAPAEATRLGIDGRIAEMERLVMERKATPPAEGQPTPPSAAAKPTPPTEGQATAPIAPPPATAPPLPHAGGAPVAAAPTPPGRAKTIAGAVVTGVGVAALITGIALAVVGHTAYDTLQNPPAGYVYDPATQDAMKADWPAGLALVGVGAAAVIAGAAVLTLGVREQRRTRVAVAPAVGPSSAGATVRLSF